MCCQLIASMPAAMTISMPSSVPPSGNSPNTSQPSRVDQISCEYTNGASAIGEAHVTARISKRCPVPPKNPITIISPSCHGSGACHANGSVRVVTALPTSAV